MPVNGSFAPEAAFAGLENPTSACPSKADEARKSQHVRKCHNRNSSARHRIFFSLGTRS
jgi:hypothetical protein